MKHLLLPLLLLTPISLFPANGAASASPATGAAAGGVAGAPAEGEAKRGEADEKEGAGLTGPQGLALIPELQGILPVDSESLLGDPSVIVASYLVNGPDQLFLVPLMGQRWYKELLRQAIAAAQPRIGWRGITQGVMQNLSRTGKVFPRDLALIVADYAQDDLVPLEDVVERLITPERMVEWPIQAYQKDDPQQRVIVGINQLHELARVHGVVWPHSKELLERWTKMNFVYDQARYDDRIANDTDRLVCAACGPRVITWGGQQRRQQAHMGDIAGIGCFEWLLPVYYHKVDCEWMNDIEHRDIDDRGQFLTRSYGLAGNGFDPIPVLRNDPRQFAYYVMRHLDWHARNLLRLEEPGDQESGALREKIKSWDNRLKALRFFMVSMPRMLAYAQDPEGWKERENKRAEELGSAVRYPMKKDQPK